MIHDENLLSNAQNFITPNLIRKISSEIHEPERETESGLRSALPTLVTELVSRGVTLQGAEEIINFTKLHPGNELPPTSFTDSYFKEGEEAIGKLYAPIFPSVVSQIGATSGLSLASVAKLLKLLAPLVVGLISSKIRKEDLNPNKLRTYLAKQSVSDTSYAASVRGQAKKARAVPVAAAIILLLLIGLWWFMNLTMTSEEIERDISEGPAHGWAP